MADDDRLRIGWTARAAPLAPRAVVARGAAARALGARLTTLDDDALAALTAVAGDGVLIVLGDGDALPWVEGVVYLGRDPAAPELLLPTAQAPTVPAAVLAHAVRAWCARAATVAPPPLALVPSPLQLVACGGARAIERDRLAAWLAPAGAPS